MLRQFFQLLQTCWSEQHSTLYNKNGDGRELIMAAAAVTCHLSGASALVSAALAADVVISAGTTSTSTSTSTPLLL